MDREKQDEVARLQLSWIDGVCLPLYKVGYLIVWCVCVEGGGGACVRACVRAFMLGCLVLSFPKGWGCLMSSPCLESHGPYLIPLSNLLSRFSASSSC